MAKEGEILDPEKVLYKDMKIKVMILHKQILQELKQQTKKELQKKQKK